MLAAALLVVAALGAAYASDGICTLNVHTQLNAREEPLILEVNETRDKRPMLEIIRPQVEVVGGKTQGVIHVLEGKQLLVACTGSGNTLKATEKESGYAECSNGKLTINSKPANEENLSCSKGVAKSAVVKSKEEKCGKGANVGTTFELGFKLTDGSQETFFPMVEVCHNIDKMVTYYTTHQVYGASLNAAIKSSDRRGFSPAKEMGLFSGVSPDEAYSQKGQKEALDDILGAGRSGDYVSKNVFLARGHLSPDADFIYNSGQQMTYYYINAAPQWQSFNAFNWLAVENTVRKLAAKEEATINVWTGTYGILKLKDNEGNEKEIYLDPKESTKTKKPKKSKKTKEPKNPEDSEESEEPREDHLPVPAVYWKLVQHPTKLSCTVAVGHNDVFLKEPPTPICDTQEVDGWPTLTRLDKGFVYYCDYESFKKTVDYVPDVECTDLFKFPHSH